MERATVDGKNVLLYKFSSKNYWEYDKVRDEYIYKFKLSDKDFSNYIDKLHLDIYTPYMKSVQFKPNKYIHVNWDYYSHRIVFRVSNEILDDLLEPDSVYDYYILQIEV